MAIFSNLRIQVRLALGFMAMLVMTAAMGVVGMTSAAKLAEIPTQLHDHPYTVVEQLAKARVAFRTLRLDGRDLILADSPEELARVQADIDKNTQDYYAAMAVAKSAFLGDTAALDETVGIFTSYRAVVDEIGVKSKAGDREAALALLRSKGDPISQLATQKNNAIHASASKRAEGFMASADATRTEVVQLLSGILVLALALGAAVAFLTARSIVRPINAMTGVMGELASHNLSVEVPFSQRGDEVGVMAKAVRHFKDQLVRVKQLELEQEEQKRRAEADRLVAMRKMADNFEGSVGKVIETVSSAATELQAASGQMSSTAAETSAQSTAVASAAQEASANVETVASATEQLSASIKEIAHQVELSQTVSQRAGQEADQTTAQMRELSEKVGKIGDIVNLINDIATQTNLLALNATIEAARAGEAGKGFAVVAGEVKNLANQTGHATSEIAAQITAVQEGTSTAVHAIDSIAKVIGEMGEISSAVAAAVQEQTAATDEIARNIEQAAAGTSEVTSNIVAVEEAARETGEAAAQITESATDLSRQAELLRQEVGNFLVQVRADKKDVTLLTWRDELNTNIATIDRYHRKLFDQVNDFYRQMMSGQGGKAALSLLKALEDGMRDHFQEEEGLMSKFGYGDLAQHRATHKAFFDHIPSIRKAIDDNHPDATTDLFDYVSTWMQQHISQDDRKLAVYLRGKKVA